MNSSIAIGRDDHGGHDENSGHRRERPTDAGACPAAGVVGHGDHRI